MKNSTHKTNTFIYNATLTNDDLHNHSCAKADFFESIDTVSKRDGKIIDEIASNMRDKEQFAYVNTSRLFEEIIAKGMKSTYSDIQVAEDANMANAMGFDVFSLDNHMYLEMKDYSLTRRGGTGNSKLSANIDIKNKFGPLVVLITNAYIGRGYDLYVIPQYAIFSDKSDCIDLSYCTLAPLNSQATKFIAIENETTGGAFAQYKVESIDDLCAMKDVLTSINIKRLVSVIRAIENSVEASGSQKTNVENLKNTFAFRIKQANREKSRANNKLPLDWNSAYYDIIDEDNNRIMYDGKTITETQPQNVVEFEARIAKLKLVEAKTAKAIALAKKAKAKIKSKKPTKVILPAVAALPVDVIVK